MSKFRLNLFLTVLVAYFVSASLLSQPNVLSPTMTDAEAREALKSFLIDARSNGRLITLNEYQERKYTTSDVLFKESHIVERVMGAEHLRRIINKLSCKFVKVPQKILVMNDDENLTLEFEGRRSLMSLASDQLKLRVEKIPAVERLLTFDEIKELVAVIKESGYSDIDHSGSNFVISHDGVYFIDTEFKSFNQGITLEKINRLHNLVVPQERNKFDEWITSQDLIKDNNVPRLSPDFSSSRFEFSRGEIFSIQPQSFWPGRGER